MSVSIDCNRSVAALLLENPARAVVFEHYKIDYCCQGKRPLAEACERSGVAEETVVQKLTEMDGSSHAGSGEDWSSRSCATLIDNILALHHSYVKRELPRLTELADKVARVHGGKAPDMIELAGVVRRLRAELESHLEKEEEVLFPFIAKLELEQDSPFPTINSQISCMEHEHSDAGEALEAIRRLTNDHTPPIDACNTWRVLYHALAAFERDLHVHIHKENNMLFPRALAMERTLRAGSEQR